MASRLIQLPLSGRDRRYYVAELRKAEEAHRRHVRDAEEAHAVADRALARAYQLDCDAWTALQFIGGDEDPSPVIAHCIHGGRELLEVQCRQCNQTQMIDLTLSIWPRNNQVHTLRRVLYCKGCLTEYGKKRRPDLVGLRQRPGPDPVAPAAARRKAAR